MNAKPVNIFQYRSAMERHSIKKLFISVLCDVKFLLYFHKKLTTKTTTSKIP